MPSDNRTQKKRYAVVGTGGRCVMFIDAILGDFRQHADLVAFCDPSATRMAWHNQRIGELFGARPVATYAPADFDAMLREQRVDTVIVTSMDATHHVYIIRAMELGCDVISEKPMTTDVDKARAILNAVDQTGRSLRMSFNYRYAPPMTLVKQLVMNGEIGTPTAVTFNWLLDTRHGADYFRRWHANRSNSGGLLVHKSTHHFDLVNWWIDSRPQTVFALGDLSFYGRVNAQTRGQEYSYERYTGQVEAKGDPFALDLAADDRLRQLYLEAEKDSGYIRDRNVFGDHIDIEDTMAVLARYDNGVIFNYSLVAYSPWEGFHVAITGTRGRLELFEQRKGHIIAGQGDRELAAEQAEGERHRLMVYPMFGTPRQVPIPHADGGHGGGDPLLLDQIFNPAAPPDPLHRAASHIDGAASVLLGFSANQSIATGKQVVCNDLMSLEVTDETPATTRSQPA